jgi:hypothetical protein
MPGSLHLSTFMTDTTEGALEELHVAETQEAQCFEHVSSVELMVAHQGNIFQAARTAGENCWTSL